MLIASSDGQASLETDGPIALGLGESLAWATMPGTPPLPLNGQISGQSYRLDAYPAELAQDATVKIYYEEIIKTVNSAGVGRSLAATAAIYFWDGVQWTKLPTTISLPNNSPDAVSLASAPSRGVGVYAVLVEQSGHQLFLPWVNRQ